MAADDRPSPDPRQILPVPGGHQLILFVGRDGYDIMLDAELRLASGERFGGTFATLDQIGRTMDEYGRTGEGLSGRYFWADALVIVQRLDAETVTAVTADLLRTGELQDCFRLLKHDEGRVRA